MTMLPGTQTVTAKDRDDWLVKMSWGLFLVGAGVVWLIDNIVWLKLGGLVWVWGGLLLVALNGLRYTMRIRMSKGTLGLGVILLIWGLSDLVGVEFPFLAILFIVLGGGMLLEAFMSQRYFKRNDTDYEVDQTPSLQPRP